MAALFLAVRTRWRNQPGARFAAFMGGYCSQRFLLEFLKPPFGPTAAGSLMVDLYAVLTAIRWVALFGLMVYGWLYALRIRPEGAAALSQASIAGS